MKLARGAESLEDRVAAIYERVVTRSTAETQGLVEIMGSRRRLVWVNFLSGLSRGVGFFLGATLVGGLLLGAGALFVDATAETLGLKGMTTQNLVRTVYEKIVEIRAMVANMDASGAQHPAPADVQPQPDAADPPEGTPGENR